MQLEAKQTEAESESESDIEWQYVSATKKRRRLKSPEITKNTNRITVLNDIATTSNQNFYSSLSCDEESINSVEMANEINNMKQTAQIENNENNNNSTIKPPPIIIPDVSNVNKMIKTISNAISTTLFDYKCINNEQIRILVKTVHAYRTLVNYFKTKKVKFHTYQLKNERAYRVVIKNLHHSTNIEDIKSQIELLGHKVRNIINIRHRISKQPLPMFYVDLEPDNTNKNIFELKHINNAIIKVEAPRKSLEIVQCYRCQEFGHIRSYFYKNFKCVKCGSNHLTTHCDKNKDIPAQCANCHQAHPASYKGCTVYQEQIQKRRQNIPPQTAVRMARNFSLGNSNFPHLPNSTNNTNNRNNNNNNNNFNNTNRQTFASVTANEIQQNDQTKCFERIEMLLNKQLEMTNNLLNIMTMLLNKICN